MDQFSEFSDSELLRLYVNQSTSAQSLWEQVCVCVCGVVWVWCVGVVCVVWVWCGCVRVWCGCVSSLCELMSSLKISCNGAKFTIAHFSCQTSIVCS